MLASMWVLIGIWRELIRASEGYPTGCSLASCRTFVVPNFPWRTLPSMDLGWRSLVYWPPTLAPGNLTALPSTVHGCRTVELDTGSHTRRGSELSPLVRHQSSLTAQELGTGSHQNVKNKIKQTSYNTSTLSRMWSVGICELVPASSTCLCHGAGEGHGENTVFLLV